MRASELCGLAALGALAAAAACTPRVLTVVDPKDPLLTDLVGWWRFDDGLGSALARDSSGRGNDGMLVDVDSSNAFTWQPGVADKSLELTGAGYVNVPRSDSIDAIVDQITVSAWIYYEGFIPIDYGTALSREIGDTLSQHYHLSIYKDDSPVLFVTTLQSGSLVGVRLSAAAVPRSMWTHLAGTYDGTTARLYLNGVSVATGSLTGPFAPETNPLVLGGNGNGAGMGVTERFPGRVDEIMLYKRALGPAEIARLASGYLFSSPDGGAADLP